MYNNIGKKIFFSLTIISLLCTLSCGNSKNTAADNSKGLKDYYADYFTMGVAVSAQSLDTDEAALVTKQFASITPENAMKMAAIHPKENEYSWKDADAIVAFAEQHNMKLRGHCLCWHNQTPDWIFVKDGKPVSKEILLQRLKAHIQKVVGRYKGKIYAWDVVNEAISDNENENYRPSKWFTIIGESYIAKAFEYAHEADPDALLFYNDYNEIDSIKRAKIISMIKGLQASGVPITGIGLQSHWAADEPSREQLDKTLHDFSLLKLNMQITELDISVYRKNSAANTTETNSGTAFTTEKEDRQIAMYKMCFELFRKYKDAIAAITFWNISDRYSWLDNFPVKNRKDYPLVFDKHLEPKKAFNAIVDFK